MTPKDFPARNYAFEVSFSRPVSGLNTGRGICEANEEGYSDIVIGNEVYNLV